MTEVDEQVSDLQPPPRPVTPRGSRRAWGDRRVRFWWISALGVSLIVMIFAAERVMAAMAQRDLIANGTPVRALVIGMERSTRDGYTLSRADSLDVVLKAPLPDGRTLHLEGVLPSGSGVVRIGSTEIDIRVDPNNPSRWTDRTEATAWSTELIIPILMLPLIALLMLIAIIRRHQVLRIWRNGHLVQGVVLELRQSAIAPLSRLVRYTLPDRDKRVFSTLMPVKAGLPIASDAIDLLVLSDNPERAIVAKLYE